MGPRTLSVQDTHGPAGSGQFTLMTTGDVWSCGTVGLLLSRAIIFGVISVFIQGREFQLLKEIATVIIATE